MPFRTSDRYFQWLRQFPFVLGHKTTTWKGKLRTIGRKNKKLCLTGSKIHSRIWRDGVVIGRMNFLLTLELRL